VRASKVSTSSTAGVVSEFRKAFRKDDAMADPPLDVHILLDIGVIDLSPSAAHASVSSPTNEDKK
jgi:hypothetical protein